jgi:pilus assembly protein Flp/PilA
MRIARCFAADTRGANMVEYVILVGMVALIAFAGFKYFGDTTRAKIDQQGDAIGKVNGGTQ